MQNTILKFIYGALAIATVSTTGAAVTKISASHKTTSDPALTSAPTSTIQSSGQIIQSSQNNSKVKDRDGDEEQFERESDD